MKHIQFIANVLIKNNVLITIIGDDKKYEYANNHTYIIYVNFR